MKRFIGFMLVAVACAVVPARAQDYPNKQIVLVVPFAAGGPTDTLARNLGVTLTSLLKQQVIIDNAGGAGGTIGINNVAKAKNDGYTLLLMHIGMSTSPALYRKLPLRHAERLRIHRPGRRRADDHARQKGAAAQ